MQISPICLSLQRLLQVGSFWQELQRARAYNAKNNQ